MTEIVSAIPVLFGVLFSGSLDRAIDREFPQTEVSYLLIDARTRETLASRWP